MSIIGPDIVIITDADLEARLNASFQRGVERGRFEEAISRNLAPTPDTSPWTLTYLKRAPLPGEAHYPFYVHIRDGGTVRFIDRSTKCYHFLTLKYLGGDATAIYLYRFTNLEIMPKQEDTDGTLGTLT